MKSMTGLRFMRESSFSGRDWAGLGGWEVDERGAEEVLEVVDEEEEEWDSMEDARREATEPEWRERRVWPCEHEAREDLDER
jgi:hypothetical protein